MNVILKVQELIEFVFFVTVLLPLIEQKCRHCRSPGCPCHRYSQAKMILILFWATESAKSVRWFVGSELFAGKQIYVWMDFSVLAFYSGVFPVLDYSIVEPLADFLFCSGDLWAKIVSVAEKEGLPVGRHARCWSNLILINWDESGLS